MTEDPPSALPEASRPDEADRFDASAVSPPSLSAILEALLFVADGPIALSTLAAVTERDEASVAEALAALDHAWRSTGRGLRVQRTEGAAQAVTAPPLAPWVERFLGSGVPVRLSPATMETLAIVAYRQPVTRAQIEAIRGVSADRGLTTLLSRGLVAEVGRLEAAGRPVLFGTTPEFLQHFGLTSLDDLPPFARFAELQEREATASATDASDVP